MIVVQFARLLRDLPCFGLLLLLTATLYRLPPTLLKLRAATKRLLLDPVALPPALTAVTARAAITAKGAARLVIRGTKPAGFAPAQMDLAVGGAPWLLQLGLQPHHPSCTPMNARCSPTSPGCSPMCAGEPFWKAAEAAFGGTAALGKTLLPLRLTSKQLAPGSLKQGETEAVLDPPSPPAHPTRAPLHPLHSLHPSPSRPSRPSRPSHLPSHLPSRLPSRLLSRLPEP